MLGAKDAYLELANGNESVVVTILEINEAHGRAFFTCLPVLADARVLQKEMKDMFVVFDQSCAWEASGELLDDFVDLIVFQPWIDDLELLSQTPDSMTTSVKFSRKVSPGF